MNIIDPYAITNTTLTATNVTEADHPVWDISTTYDADDRVIVIGDVHKIYQSVSGSNLGNEPSGTTASTAEWVYVGATNRWKPFDQRTSDPVTRVTPIQYTITDSRYVASLAFFNIQAANEVEITITDTGAVEVYNETVNLIDTSHMTDWFLFFTEVPRYVRQKLVLGLPFTAGADVELEFRGATGATIGVGQIVLGRSQNIGETVTGTRPGFVDYSRKDRDAFGEPIIVARDFKRRVEYAVAIDTQRADNIIEDLAALRAKGAVYFADSDTGFFGTTIYGLLSDFDVPLATNKSFINIEVQSL